MEIYHCHSIFASSPKKGFPWNWVPVLEIKNVNDGAIGPTRSLTITRRDIRMDRQTDKWTWDDSKTVLTCSVLRLKPHQIVLMCCCTASIIHTYWLIRVPIWLEQC